MPSAGGAVGITGPGSGAVWADVADVFRVSNWDGRPVATLGGKGANGAGAVCTGTFSTGVEAVFWKSDVSDTGVCRATF